MSPSRRTLEVVSRVRNAIVELQLTKISVACTRLDHARKTGNAKTMQRALYRAYGSYKSTLRLLPKLRPTDEQRNRLAERIAALETRLAP